MTIYNPFLPGRTLPIPKLTCLRVGWLLALIKLRRVLPVAREQIDGGSGEVSVGLQGDAHVCGAETCFVKVNPFELIESIQSRKGVEKRALTSHKEEGEEEEEGWPAIAYSLK